jgi:hypothetical protein
VFQKVLIAPFVFLTKVVLAVQKNKVAFASREIKKDKSDQTFF